MSCNRSKQWRIENPERWRQHQLNYRKRKRKSCAFCGGVVPYPSPGRKYCSNKCKVSVRKKKDKEVRGDLYKQLSVYKQGIGCSVCGYNKCSAALDFHHKDSNKERRITIRSWKTALGQAEIKKCILLCSNCHRELHHNESTSLS